MFKSIIPFTGKVITEYLAMTTEVVNEAEAIAAANDTESGYDRELGVDGIREFVNIHSVWVTQRT